METTTHEHNSIRRTIDVRLSNDELKPYIDEAYKSAQKNVALKGFRKGKTPVNVLKKMYGNSIEGEAVEKAINDTFSRVAEEQELRAVGTPAIINIDRADDGSLNYTVMYELMPEFELQDYKGIAARRLYHIVSEDLVDEHLQRLQERFVKHEEAESAADESHVVTVDIQKLDEAGHPIIGEVSRSLPVQLWREDINPELKEKLLSSSAGTHFRIDLPTGEDEAPLPYEVTVTEVNRAIRPEINDELAREVLEDEGATLEELRSVARDGIAAEYEAQYRRYFRDELVNNLLEGYEFEVPEALVFEVLKSFEEDQKKGPNRELPSDFDREAFVEEMRPAAERTVRWALIRDRIIEAEGLTAEQSDYEQLAQVEAQRLGIGAEQLLAYFQGQPQIADRILAEKVMQLLEDHAIVEDVEDVEFAKSQQASDEDSEERSEDAAEGESKAADDESDELKAKLDTPLPTEKSDD